MDTLLWANLETLDPAHNKGNNNGLALYPKWEWGMTPANREKKSADRRGWRPILRAADQAAVAGLVLVALVGMGVYWIVQGGLRGELIEIDRAAPLVARFQVDVNAAGWPELSQLPDVGETLARRIVESRAGGRAICRSRRLAARERDRPADVGADEAVFASDAGSG